MLWEQVFLKNNIRGAQLKIVVTLAKVTQKKLFSFFRKMSASE